MIINIIHLNELQTGQSPYPKVVEAEAIRRQNYMEQMADQRAKFIIHDGVLDRPSFKGIGQAHKNVVRYAKKMNMEMVCIAEDDIQFTHPDSYKYFLKNIPKSFDLYFGVIYHGSVSDSHRVMNGFSGGLTLYIVHNKFYDKFINVSDDNHIDNNLGQLAWDQEYYVCHPHVCKQMGGYSLNHYRELHYSEYEKGKSFYNG